MRALLIILVLANAGFAAWALLVDRPVVPLAARDISKLKHLTLATEMPAGKTSAPPAAMPAAGSAPAPAAAVAPAMAAVPMVSAPPRCVTVGPFDALERAAAAAARLKSQGFAPSQRAVAGAGSVEYWVYLGGFATDAIEARVLKQLQSKGLHDAAIMPVTNQGRRLSLGLFSERARAEHRAHDARALGVTPKIEQQPHAEATYWVDVTLSAPNQSVSLEGLQPAGAQAAHLTLRSCPTPALAQNAAAATPQPSQPL